MPQYLGKPKEETPKDQFLGVKWQENDVIGVSLDLDRRTIGYSLNGRWERPMGVAFRGLDVRSGVRIGASVAPGFLGEFVIDREKFTCKPPPVTEYEKEYLSVGDWIKERERKKKRQTIQEPVPEAAKPVSEAADTVPEAAEATPAASTPLEHVKLRILSGYRDSELDPKGTTVSGLSNYPTVIAEVKFEN
jgi:hypothetical protein